MNGIVVYIGREIHDIESGEWYKVTAVNIANNSVCLKGNCGGHKIIRGEEFLKMLKKSPLNN